MDEVAAAITAYDDSPSSPTSLSSPSSSSCRQHIAKSINLIIDTLRIFGGSSVAISFNGGKDACVILYLLIAALQSPRTKETPKMLGNEIKIVYFDHELEFTEMTNFLGTNCQ